MVLRRATRTTSASTHRRLTAQVYRPTGEGVVFFMDYNNLRCLYDNGGRPR